MWVFFVVSTALAGDGPWTLSARDHNVFVGADYYRYGRLETGTGSTAALGSGMTATGLTGVWTFGVTEGLDAQLKLPFESVRANDPQASLCVDGRAKDFCSPTSGIGDIELRVKGRVLNELYTSPVSLAVMGGARSGEAYAGERGRLTTLGDGQTDVGAGVSVGRTDVAGSGWYRASADVWYWARFANSVDDGQKVPADELAGAVAAMWSPVPLFAVGPAAHGFYRLAGRTVAGADFDDIDVWGSLAARQVQAGGKLGLYAPDGGPTVSLTFLRTVWAQNNPSDTLVISLGVGVFLDRG